MIKLFGKSRKASSDQNNNENLSRRTPPPRFVLMAGAGGLLGVLATYTLLQLLLITPYTEQVQQQQQRTNLATASTILNHTLSQLQHETQALAASRPVAEALLTKDLALQNKLAASATGAINDALQVRIRIQGDHQQDRSGKIPMNYAAIDLQRRVEQAQAVQPEFSKNGQHWSLQSAAPIRSGNRIIGTLLVHYDPQRISKALQSIPKDQGRIELLQQFNGSPSQTVLTQGQGSGTAETLATRNPLWQLRFTPGPAIINNTPDTLVLPLSVSGGLLIVLISTLLVIKLQHQAHRKDAAQLLELIKARLAGQDPATPQFILPVFRNLALTLAELLQNSAKSAPKSASKPQQKQAAEESALDELSLPAEGSTPPLAELVDANDEFSAPLFQDDDILNIEELDNDLLIEEAPAEPSATVSDGNSGTELPPEEIFRAYDIRGIVGQTLTEAGVEQIGRAIGAELQEQGQQQVVVGADGRLSSPTLKQSLIHGLLQSGIDVTDIGQVPTPALYFATYELGCPNGVMLTGSHNPANYNGLKIVINGQTLAETQLKALHQRLQENRLTSGQGSLEQANINERYQDRILEDVVLARPLKVVVDCGNGVAGPIVTALYAELNCEVIPLYCEVDGEFPNHHPDPSKPANLQPLIDRVRSENADLGLAFDGDGDRVGLVTNLGEIVWPDRLLMLLAKDVVTRNPGADIIFDVKCTRKLNNLISGYGGRPVMWKTGHSLVKAKMQETGALLAGEMSGHIFFKERWYGFDDGIYSGARLLEVLAAENRPVDQVFAAFPEGFCTPEINIEVDEAEKFAIIAKLARQGDFEGGTLIDIDGLRVEYPDGWGLVRASNTTPVLVLRFEAETEETLLRLKHLFKQQIMKVAPTLAVDF